jgi:signal peptide peptidase SppA
MSGEMGQPGAARIGGSAGGVRCELADILAGHEPRLVGVHDLPPATGEWVRRVTAPAVTRQGAAAVVRLDGPLMNEPGFVSNWGLCITHEAFAAECGKLEQDASVSTVVLDMHCPGWGVFGSSQSINAVERLKAAGKRVVAYGRDLVASGGTWLAALCDEVVLSPTAMIGSIGTLAIVYDTSKMFEDMGVSPVVLASDPDKACGAAGVPITETWKQNQQRMVDEHSRDFFEAVSKGRGIPVASIAAMKAGMYGPRDAVAMKLADRVEDYDDFLAGVARVKQSGRAAGAPVARKDMSMTESMNEAGLRAAHGPVIQSIESTARAAGKAEAQQEAEASAKAPATFDQLLAAFGDKDMAFIAQCQKDKVTLAAAYGKRIGALEASVAAAEQKATAAETKLAEAQKGKAPAQGGAAVPFNGQAAGEAVKDFQDAVQAVMAKDKCNLAVATHRASQTHKDLHAQWKAAGCPALAAA